MVEASQQRVTTLLAQSHVGEGGARLPRMNVPRSSVVWLARLTSGQEVAGSNPVAPNQTGWLPFPNRVEWLEVCVAAATQGVCIVR